MKISEKVTNLCFPRTLYFQYPCSLGARDGFTQPIFYKSFDSFSL